MEPNKYEKRYKEFIKAINRLDEVEEELRNLPLRPLKIPFQRGWEVSIRLRDDIARRSDVDTIYKIIELGYHEGYVTQSLNEVKAIRRGEKSIPYIDWRGRKGNRSLIPTKRHITEKQYEELPESIKKYLDFDRLCEIYKKYGRKTYSVYLPEYWLNLKARPHIVTHQYIKGGELERERDELRSFLEQYWRECGRGYYKEDRWKDDRKKIKINLRKLIKCEIEDVN